ncbi:MAG: tetratricopeptide repeat protein [Gemmatimonadota bacterium]
MKIRYGLVLAAALGLGLTGCASGGGGGGGGGGVAGMIAEASGDEGVPPRETENTDQARELIESAEDAGSPAAAAPLYSQALAAAEAEIAASPDNPLGHRLAAIASLGLENYQEAGAFFDRAGELYPLYEFQDAGMREQTWIDLYNQAMPLIGEAEYETAAVYLDDANAIFASRPEAFITAGQIYAQLRQHDKALDNLTAAEEIIAGASEEDLDAETLAAWREQGDVIPLLRAQILSDAGRFEEASAVFAEILAENPGDTQMAMNLAATQMQTGDEAGAMEIYGRLLNDPSVGPTDLYRIGIGFYQGRDYERASEAFGQAAEANRMDRDALEMWTRSLQIDSVYTAVPDVAERWIELDPNSQNALLIYAQSANQIGDSQLAGELVQRIEALEVTVDELQMRRYPSGGAQVTGTVSNQALSAGTSATLTFTFYSIDGAQLGTVDHTISVGEQGMSELFQIEFDSTQQVGGYGYTLSVG